MSETLQENRSPEQRVFGDVYTISTGEVIPGANLEQFYAERAESIVSGATEWLPRVLDSDRGVAADLFNSTMMLATLNFDFETGLADIYVADQDKAPGDFTIFREQISFDDAVEAAEQFVAEFDTSIL